MSIWQGDVALTFGGYFGICCDEKEWNSCLKTLHMDKGEVPWRNTYGATVVFKNPAYGTAIIVQVNTSKSDDQILRTCIHEAVHVVQDIMDDLAEDNPGREIEAYMIEHYSTLIMNRVSEYRNKTRKKKK